MKRKPERNHVVLALIRTNKCGGPHVKPWKAHRRRDKQKLGADSN